MSEPRFLVDECLPFDVALALRERGIDVCDLFERRLRGLKDEEVWALAASWWAISPWYRPDVSVSVPGSSGAGL
jgi:hypothetical protein